MKLPLQTNIRLPSSEASQHVATEITLRSSGHRTKRCAIENLPARILRSKEFKRHTGVYVRTGRQNRARSKESCPNNVHRRSRSGQNETVQRPAVQDGIGNLLRSRKKQIISRAGGE